MIHCLPFVAFVLQAYHFKNVILEKMIVEVECSWHNMVEHHLPVARAELEAAEQAAEVAQQNLELADSKKANEAKKKEAEANKEWERLVAQEQISFE